MAKNTQRKPLSIECMEAIREHHEELIAGLEGSLEQYKKIPYTTQPEFIKGQIKYWKNAIAALKWSTRIAEQRAGVKHDKRT